MNHLVLRWSFVGFLLLPLIAAENKAPFDGTWVLDTTKNNTATQIIIRVAQKLDCLTVIEISRGEHGKKIVTSDYTVDESSPGELMLFQDAVRRERWQLLKGGSELLIERNVGCDSSVRLMFRRSTSVMETPLKSWRHRQW
jgi:hypothetical protein